MKNQKLIIGLLAGLSVGCAAAGHRATTPIQATDPASALKGSAVFSETPDGVKAVVRISGAPQGNHGIHIHENSDCGDMGKAAGGHFNPANTKHGFLPHDGPSAAHAGDMGNISINQQGSGSLTVRLQSLTLDQGERGIIGRSVILHEKPDDFGQPTGNAGGRIGCGVINGPQYLTEQP